MTWAILGLMAHHDKNLPLELWNKHEASLGLENLVVFDDEKSLFKHYPAPIQNALVFLPKSRGLIHMTLALVSGKVALGGTVVLAGTNETGIGSAKKSFETNVGEVQQKIVGSHSALYVGKNKALGANRNIESFVSFSSLSYKNTTIEAADVPGVFSTGTLDEGTKLLLDTIPYENKKILDIGSGAGIIGAFYKKIAPQSIVTLSDSSPLAIVASQKTLEKNKLDGTVVMSDVFENISGTFDIILTNPPFHKGIDTDYSFIENFARDAKAHLEKNGRVFVVANSFLPYQNLLENGIGPTKILVDTKKFRVYESVQK